MMKNVKKLAFAAAFGGMMFQLGGCLNGGGWWGRLLWGTAVSQVGEFLLDNDGVFDLFPDDGNFTPAR